MTITEFESKLLRVNYDSFETVLCFKSYFEKEKELLVNNLMMSKVRTEDIGTISFLGFIIAKLNQIQEKRDES